MNTSRFHFRNTRPGRLLHVLLGHPAPAAPQPAAEPNPQPDAAAAPDSEPRHKLLVVDDDPITCKTLSLKLSSHGYAVATAPDAAAAIGAVRDGRPDLVLLDLHFPPDVANGGMVTWDGFQTMHWLKGLEEAQGMPFIIISASEPEAYEQRALASGAIAFFQKPIKHEKLLQLIGKTLKKRELALAPKAA